MATIPTAAPPAGTHQNNNQALTVLTSLFFMMGFITCMNDILVPHLKEVFSLNYAQALLVQFCFFTLLLRDFASLRLHAFYAASHVRAQNREI